MREMTLSEAQGCIKETLYHFADFCDVHGLVYWLAYGTLIGAVRHGDIIPWDDDIDVWMPRKDYERFTRVFKDDVDYSFHYMGNDETQYDYRGIVCDEHTLHSYNRRVTDFHYGLHIDVFPLDHLDEDRRIRERNALRAYRLMDLSHRLFLADPKAYLASHSAAHGLLFRAAKATVGHMDLRTCMMKEEREAAAHLPSNWVGVIGDPTVTGFEAEWFDGTEYLDYGSRKLAVPVGYEKILRMQYGDYMVLPPEDQRKPYGHWYWKG